MAGNHSNQLTCFGFANGHVEIFARVVDPLATRVQGSAVFLIDPEVLWSAVIRFAGRPVCVAACRAVEGKGRIFSCKSDYAALYLIARYVLIHGRQPEVTISELYIVSRNNTNGTQPLLTSVTSCQTRQRMRMDCNADIVTSGWRTWTKNVCAVALLSDTTAVGSRGRLGSEC